MNEEKTDNSDNIPEFFLDKEKQIIQKACFVTKEINQEGISEK